MALRGSKVDFLSEDLSLGSNLRKVVAEVERSQMVGEGRSSQSWMASGIMPVGILVAVGSGVVVVPSRGYRFYNRSWKWITVEYGKPRVLLRIAMDETAPMDDMFSAAMETHERE